MPTTTTIVIPMDANPKVLPRLREVAEMVDPLTMRMRAMMQMIMTTTIIMKGKKARKKKNVSKTNQLNQKKQKMVME
eukprot:4419365-Karenia_brevis.AAC.1